MIESIFYIIAVILVVIAIGIVVFPFRHHKKLVITLAPILLIALWGAYYHWGSGKAWTSYLTRQQKQERVKKMLASMEGVQGVVAKLQAHLYSKPEDAKAWYLLGRLFLRQDKPLEAKNAFQRAYELQPNNIQYEVNYAQSLWLANRQKFNLIIRNIYLKVLQQDSEQPDALAMLAMDEFQQKNYQKAIQYWQMLLQQMPTQSEDAIAIRKAIEKAHKKLSPK